MQVQRRYLSARLSALQTLHFGFTFALAGATIFGILQALYSILTVPHEYGHVAAANFVGHEVRKVQVDFLDKSEAFFRGIADGTEQSSGSEPATSSSGDTSTDSWKTVDYGEDGRMGFVVYEPSIIEINSTTFLSLSAYNRFAGVLVFLHTNTLPQVHDYALWVHKWWLTVTLYELSHVCHKAALHTNVWWISMLQLAFMCPNIHLLFASHRSHRSSPLLL